jgi:2-methylcitrate dehydratase PrpD
MMTGATIPEGEPIEALATFVARTRIEDVPPTMAEKARWHMLDTFGAALAGSRSEEADRSRRALFEADGRGPAVVWGTGVKLSPRNAALVNGIAAHAFELDDTGGCDHSGAVVLPAVIAALPLAAEPVSGRALVKAVVLGYDVGRRVMEGFGGYVRHNGAGWHSTGTCGVFAAATAVASLLRLDAGATASCLGLAASCASGVWAFIHEGAMVKRVHAGRAAEGGLLSALLAKSGVTGPRRAFDDIWGGFFRTYGHGSHATQAVTRDLGRDWLLRHAAIKPYASCRDTHAAVDAIGRVMEREGLGAAEIARIRVRLNAFLAGMVGGRGVGTLAAAQMSLPYALAVRMGLGTAGLSAYSDACRSSPDLAAIMDRVAIEIDQSVTASWKSSVVVETCDGRRIEEPTTAPLGSPANPLSPAAWRAKYDELAGLVLPRAQADELAALVLGLDREKDARALIPLLRVAERRVGAAPPRAGASGET